MKKALSMLLALVMCLSLFACGGSNDSKFLFEDEWKDTLGGLRTISFNKDGSGKYASYDMEWILKDDTVRISYVMQSYDGTDIAETIELSVAKIGESIRLISSGDFSIYVPVSKYDEMCPITRRELIASTPTLDLNEMSKDLEENKAKAAQKYDNKLYIVKISAYNIEIDHIDYMYQTNNGISSIDIWLPRDVLASLDKGDELCVLGRLSNVSFFPALFDSFIVDEYTN